MYPYNDFQLSSDDIEKIKDRNYRRALVEYIKTHGAQPDDETALSFMTATAEDIEAERRTLYALRTQRPQHDPYLHTPFTIEALGSGNITWKLGDKTVQYSKNGGSWETMTKDTTISVVEGDEVQFKGNNSSYSYYDEDDAGDQVGNNLVSTIDCNVYGNIMSLVAGDNFKTANTINEYAFYYLFCDYFTYESFPVVNAKNLKLPATTLAPYCYDNMFYGCTNLTTAPELPATTLTRDCYVGMFSGCTSLTTAPDLPATTLAPYCYSNMFSGCTSLTTAPELPATTLADYCYISMFSRCTSLTTAPELPATTLADNCYGGMFSRCTSLTSAPALPATTLAEYCYDSMFSGCTSLTTAPELPATTLAEDCYHRMFYGCSRLNYIKCLATDISAYDCTLDWVRNVAASGTFVKNQNMTSWTIGETYNEDDGEYYVSGIPSGWTVVDAE